MLEVDEAEADEGVEDVGVDEEADEESPLEDGPLSLSFSTFTDEVSFAALFPLLPPEFDEA